MFPRGTIYGPWAFLQSGRRSRQHRRAHHHRGGHRLREPRGRPIPIEVVTTSLADGASAGSATAPRRGHPRLLGHPPIFPAVTIDGDLLVDGGVVNDVPISWAIAAGLRPHLRLVVGTAHYHPDRRARPVEAALTAFFVAVHARFVRELAAPRGHRGHRLQWRRRALGPVPRLLRHRRLIEEGRGEVSASSTATPEPHMTGSAWSARRPRPPGPNAAAPEPVPDPAPEPSST